MTGETITADKVDSVNTFEAPNTVVPKQIAQNCSKLTVTVAPKSVTVLTIQ